MDNADDHFSLKWNNFRSSLTEGFHDFLQEEMMVDVTLAVEGKFLQAHKLVLSVCSPYFKNLFNVNPCKHPIVILKDVTHHELSNVLQFMYRGEVGVKHEELPSFLKLADTLKLKGLVGIKIENETDSASSQGHSTVSRVKKKKEIQFTDLDIENIDSDSGLNRLKELRSARQRKRRFSNPVKTDTNRSPHSKKVRAGKSDLEFQYEDSGDEDCADDRNNDASVNLLIIKEKNNELGPIDDHSHEDNIFGSEDPEGKISADECDLSASLFESSSEIDQTPQGGVDYQMIQTKRGKDMLLYDGYTFTQNRMCKDGMRWQCSYHKCKAFCRMSSAGWLTPHKTNHDHPKPPQEDIKKRILRMELKARAQSSGATPGEIIRNALPAEEYQTTNQRTCYTRCIQRFRKSLQRKSKKPPEDIWNSDAGGEGIEKDSDKSGEPSEEGTCLVPKTHGAFPLLAKEGLKEEPLWSTHAEVPNLPDNEDRLAAVQQKIAPFRRRRITLTVKQKMNILEGLGKGFSNSDLAKMYGLSSSTISTIKKSRDSITKFMTLLNSQFEMGKRKRMRIGQNLEMEYALLQWITERKELSEPISNCLLAEKARVLNAEAGRYPTQKALMSWLQRFVSRHGIKMEPFKK